MTSQIINIDGVLCVKDQLRAFVDLAKDQPWSIHVPWSQVYITGGATASLLQGGCPKDIDIYFRDAFSMTDTVNALIKLTQYIKDVDDKYRDTVGRDGKMITERSITMLTGHSFITMHHGHPDDVRKTFDYLHCTPYYDVGTDKLYISEAQYIAAAQKILEVNNPATFTNLRENKFIKRGYTIGQSCKQWAADRGLTTTTPTASTIDLYS